ncbi:hypothetical protein MGWOODY_XGa1496 [hydrothermal vent metagenome]|uniref:Uncharacterized protein n=1 Tax=hydrothermal vent metagenome TaxID=652676 RepID=A0A160TU62_9ZZZZ
MLGAETFSRILLVLSNPVKRRGCAVEFMGAYSSEDSLQETGIGSM